jgi:hypothetical protein
MLDRFQKKFIRETVAEIENLEQVKAFYNKDDEVSKYALEMAEKGGGKKSKGKVYFKIKEYREIKIAKPEVFENYLEAVAKWKTKTKENPNMMFTVTRSTKKGK